MANVAFQELYHNTANNAAINASASESFCVTANDQQAKQKFRQAFSKLLINSKHTNDLTIKIDDGNGGTYPLPAKGGFVIDAEEGRYFSKVTITAGAEVGGVAAGALAIDYAIVIPLA